MKKKKTFQNWEYKKKKTEVSRAIEETDLETILAGDEADKLRDAFLDSVLSIFSDLSVGRQRLLHDPADISYRKVSVLLPNRAAAFSAISGRARRRIRHLLRE